MMMRIIGFRVLGELPLPEHTPALGRKREGKIKKFLRRRGRISKLFNSKLSIVNMVTVLCVILVILFLANIVLDLY
jgi:hypothetical protein